MKGDTTMDQLDQPKTGRFRKGWELAKSSWHVLKLDKELAALPIIGTLVSFLVLIPFGVLAVLSMQTTGNISGKFEAKFHSNWAGGILLFCLYVVLGIIANFFAAALVHGAIDRFRGNDPTIKSSIAAARKHFGSIAAFSLVATTIGYVLSVLEQKVPLAGKIVLWLVDTTWAIATFFAIPVIVMSDHPVGPIEATRESAQIIKKVWGESIVAEAGIGLVAMLSILLYTIGFGVVTVVVGYTLHPSGWIFLIGGIAWTLGLIFLAFIFSVLSSITKAAIYYYAQTGESPASFNKELMRSAMTPKKARKIFA